MLWAKICWSALIGAGALLMAAASVPPEEAASNLSKWAEVLGFSDAAEWLAARPADTWGLAIGATILLGSIIMLMRSPIVQAIYLLRSYIKALIRDNYIGRQFVPLRDIARRVYEETADTFDGAFAGHSSNSPEDVLNYYASECIKRGLPIFGKRPPSERLEEIPEARNLEVRNSARELWGSNPSRPAWESLHVMPKDEKRLWNSLIDDPIKD